MQWLRLEFLTGAPDLLRLLQDKLQLLRMSRLTRLGAAAYAIKAVMATSSEKDMEKVRKRECSWQRKQLPKQIRQLVLDDQRLRNKICWLVFSE